MNETTHQNHPKSLGLVILGLPLAAAFLMLMVAGQLALHRELSPILLAIVFGTVILSALTASVEAGIARRGYSPKARTNSPVVWFLGICLAWVLGYPLYLHKRRDWGLTSLLAPGLVITIGFIFAFGLSIMIFSHRSLESKHPGADATKSSVIDRNFPSPTAASFKLPIAAC